MLVAGSAVRGIGIALVPASAATVWWGDSSNPALG
jgi:hypothetical protein